MRSKVWHLLCAPIWSDMFGKTKQTVALKVIDKEKCVDKEELVQVEITILKRLNHEHIVQLFDVWELDGSYYLSMELVSVCCCYVLYILKALFRCFFCRAAICPMTYAGTTVFRVECGSFASMSLLGARLSSSDFDCSSWCKARKSTRKFFLFLSDTTFMLYLRTYTNRHTIINC